MRCVSGAPVCGEKKLDKREAETFYIYTEEEEEVDEADMPMIIISVVL